MGEVGDHGAVHLEVDLHRRAAQLGVGGGAGVGIWEAAETGDIAGQFDDALVVNVVQHRAGSGAGEWKRPWRQGFTVLYMDGSGGNTVRPCRHSGLLEA